MPAARIEAAIYIYRQQLQKAETILATSKVLNVPFDHSYTIQCPAHSYVELTAVFSDVKLTNKTYSMYRG